VALKVLRSEFSKDPTAVQRFIRSMKTVLSLRHPNLVTLYGAGKRGPYCWIAMEYIDGESLTSIIKRIGVSGLTDRKERELRVVQTSSGLFHSGCPQSNLSQSP